MIENRNDYILDTEGAVDVVAPPELETEHGRKHYRLLMAGYDLQGYQQMVDRLNRLLDEAGVPYSDFESRVAYVTGYYQIAQETKNNE